MQIFLTAYALVAVLAAATLVFLGTRRHTPQRLDSWLADLDGPREGGLSADPPANVRAAAAVALERLGPALQAPGRRIIVAVQPTLSVRMPGQTLAEVLEDLLTEMWQRSCGALLLSAVPQGSQIAISISGESPNPDRAALTAAFRGLADQIALRGGALTVRADRGHGATVTLRVAAAHPGLPAARSTEAARAPPEPTAMDAAPTL